MSSAPANLFEQQAANRRRSAWLVAGFVLFFAWVGFGGDFVFWLNTDHRYDFPFLGIITTLIALGMTSFSLRHGAKQVLWATQAWEVAEPADERQQRLVNVVEEMAIAAGVPKPTVWIVPDRDPNAFAAGSGPRDAHIAVTEGLLDVLSRDELQGVVAHEMAHIRNLDVLLMTRLAAMVGALALVSDGLTRMVHGGFLPRGGGRKAGGKGSGLGNLAIVLLVVWVISLLLAPLLSRLLAMMVSRNREYLADATGAQLTRNPLALASALEKLEGAAQPTRSITRGAAHMCIVDPLGRRISAVEGLAGDVFASHPPARLRIARLKGMAYQAAKHDGVASVPAT